MSQHLCRSEYLPPDIVPITRIVRCNLLAGHEGDHDEMVDGEAGVVTWPRRYEGQQLILRSTVDLEGELVTAEARGYQNAIEALRAEALERDRKSDAGGNGFRFRLAADFLESTGKPSSRLPDLKCLKCGNDATIWRYVSGGRYRDFDAYDCDAIGTEHFDHECKRCSYRWTSIDMLTGGQS